MNWAFVPGLLLCGIGLACFSFDAGGRERAEANRPSSNGEILALDDKYRGRWETRNGEWKFEDGALYGSGDSTINFRGPFQPPFNLSFRIRVISGMRPRVKFGPITFANEGYKKTFQIANRGPRVEYELNREYQISIDVKSDGALLCIDGNEQLSASNGIGEIPVITFRGGDNWSRGETCFSEILIRPANPAEESANK
jgi:hypothetical protein